MAAGRRRRAYECVSVDRLQRHKLLKALRARPLKSQSFQKCLPALNPLTPSSSRRQFLIDLRRTEAAQPSIVSLSFNKAAPRRVSIPERQLRSRGCKIRV